MSATNRPPTRWPSSKKSTVSINQITPFMTTGKKLNRPGNNNNNQHQLTQRTTKTRHDIEQLFKLYYSTNIKFETFQREVVTGTRIPSARTSASLPNQLLHNPSNVFQSKHCVSREQLSPLDLHDHQTLNIESKQTPIKRTVQVRLDHNPTIVPSISPSPETLPVPLNSHSIAPENSPCSTQQNDDNESSIINSVENMIATDFSEYNHLKRSKTTIGQHPITTFSSVSSLTNNRKDPLTLSHPSLSTSQPHMVTGTAIPVRQRSRPKSALNKQRIKSGCQQTNLKTSTTSLQHDPPEVPMSLGARVVSIPSKCSRYVLLTFPQVPLRYHAPTYVERLLLPERFPALFENIIHNRNNK